MRTLIIINPLEEPRNQCKVRTLKKLIILTHLVVNILIMLKDKLLPAVNYVFIPIYNGATKQIKEIGGIYNHIVDATFSFIQIRNDSDSDITLARHVSVGYIEECEEQEIYLVDPKAHEFGRDILGIRPSSICGKSLGTLMWLKDAVRWKNQGPRV
jgi:hypothetical protein